MTVMAAMKKGKHYFALASGASHAEKTRFFVDDQEAENVMTSDESCADACLEAKVLPWVDICSDVIGANSLFPYFLSAAQDSATWDVGASGALRLVRGSHRHGDRRCRSLHP